MIDPASGPFLFDTSAEGWLARNERPEFVRWLRHYLALHLVHISAATVVERIRGYSLLWRRAPPERRPGIEAARIAYLNQLGRVLPLDAAVAVVAGEILAMLPEPPKAFASVRRIPPGASCTLAV